MPSRPGAAFLPSTSPTLLAGVLSAYGRVGNVVGAEGDYTIDQMSDVDTTTTTPVTGNLLSWDGTNWVPSDDVDGGVYA